MNSRVLMPDLASDSEAGSYNKGPDCFEKQHPVKLLSGEVSADI
jgi:hypothetical protein